MPDYVVETQTWGMVPMVKSYALIPIGRKHTFISFLYLDAADHRRVINMEKSDIEGVYRQVDPEREAAKPNA